MSEIRDLLSSAQAAEQRGRRDEAGRLLRQAAAFYRDRQMLRRAAQMLRQARRVEGLQDEAAEGVFGFDDEPGEVVLELPEPEFESGGVAFEQRSPQLAEPGLDAWCSFCCRPGTEVGPLVAGPAGAYVCAACVSTSSGLLRQAPAAAPAWEVRSLTFELPAQRRARLRFERARARLALVIGPEGTGKSAWLSSLGAQDGLRRLEVEGPLAPEAEEELLRWVQAPARSAFLVVRGPVPPPALVLQGEHGDEPLHDTATLVDAVPQLSPRLLGAVDAVLPFEHPAEADLARLAGALAQARGVVLSDAVLAQVVAIALKAQRGAHELATLIARLAPGAYRP